MFFTLEYTKREAEHHIRSLDNEAVSLGDTLEIVTSDDICAEFIIHHLTDAARGTVAVVDYLQILDQRRSKPELSEQMRALQNFARRTGVVLGFISQIDRSFDAESKGLPDIQDIRLPNHIDPHIFSKACFLHEGKFQFHTMT